MIIKDARASESSHWYDKDGAPMYTVKSKKDGTARNTTLRDARQLKLYPSVTTVMSAAAKPALTHWLQEQVLLSALTLPKRVDEADADYCARIIDDSKQQGRSAADLGTEIHESIERFYSGTLSLDDKHLEHVIATSEELSKKFGIKKFVAERSFSHELGFGGKVDLFAHNLVVDVKTKEFSEVKGLKGYDEHLMQLAAYRVGLGMPEARCANIFVSRNVKGLVSIIEWSAEDLNRGWNMFYHLLQFWQQKNSYKP